MDQIDASPKKRKLTHEDEAESNQNESNNPNKFSKFQVIRVLLENSQRKMMCVQGKFEGQDDNAVVIMEKTPFSKETAQNILSQETECDHSLQNDIYGTYSLYPQTKFNSIKSTLIYPATDKHISKYSEHEMCLVEETADCYNNITLPHLLQEKFSIQWVYNILEKKKEADRIVHEDPDPDIGFILVPDMKWDRQQLEDLYLVAIVHRHGIKSLRDLDESYLPLLKNVLKKGKAAILEKYGLPSNKLRIYLHYQPSYYHLHVHFTHVKYDAPGSGVERAHLLSDVISNIELMSDYYQKKTLSFMVKENEGLYLKYKEKGIL